MHAPTYLNPWVKCLNPTSTPALRLFCLPYAGGGSAIFRSWLHQLPSSIEICPIQLPGREERVREPAFEAIAPLVQTVSRHIRPYLDVPYAFFGHSMGALISFELAQKLRFHQAPPPLHLFVSGCRAPHIPNPRQLHTLADSLLLHELKCLKGTPQQILDNPELMQLLMPTLRADFAICETYTYIEQPPLDCPISVFGGTEDSEAPADDLKAWHRYTRLPLSLFWLPGNHFFLNTRRTLLLEIIAVQLKQHSEQFF
ncbi:thioesterase [Leptolyngbya sp. FACHB-16]|uniref:thioesterase II family protein n=1 Tax=unclassified Leptolyngbya TaxID=2650499 RepID=UPI0016848787|nr:thioesterase [Leptolyngbya sp. FACHB-16]MBD2153038.1 thioesterase [Leptolyngbya sp. FACHB-16]